VFFIRWCLTLPILRQTPGIGTALDPDHINDNVLANYSLCDAVGEFCEIALDRPRLLQQFRQYGRGTQTTSGRFKIQYWDGALWIDWKTDIPTRAASWSDWETVRPVLASKIRVVATSMDSWYGPNSNMGELEIKY